MDIRIVGIGFITKKLWPSEVSSISGLANYAGGTSEEGGRLGVPWSSLGILIRMVMNGLRSMLGVHQSDQNPILASWTLFKPLISYPNPNIFNLHPSKP